MLAADEGLHALLSFCDERNIADAEPFVHEQNIGLYAGNNRESASRSTMPLE